MSLLVNQCAVSVADDIATALDTFKKDSNGIISEDNRERIEVQDKKHKFRVIRPHVRVRDFSRQFAEELKYAGLLDRLNTIEKDFVFKVEDKLKDNNKVLDGEGEVLGEKFTYGLNPFTRDLIDISKLPESVRSLHTTNKEIVSSLVDTWKNSFINAKGKDTRNDSVKKNEIKWLAKINPAYALLFNSEDGGIEGKKEYTVDDINNNLNNGVLLAITLGSLDGLNESIGDLLRSNFDKNAPLFDQEEVADLGGTPANFLAESMGQSIVKMLGIKPNKDTSREDYRKLVHGLGAIGMQLLSDDKLGILESFDSEKGLEVFNSFKGNPKDIQDSNKRNEELVKADPTFIAVANEGDPTTFLNRMAILRPSIKNSPVLFETLNKVIDVIEGLTGDPKNYKSPTTKRLKKTTVSVRRGNYTKPSSTQKDMVNNFRDAEYVFNEGSDIVGTLVAKDTENTSKLVLARMGLAPINDNMSKDAYTTTKAKNDAVQRSWDFYKSLVKKVGSKGIFYDWFISTNDRTSINSNTVNPQAEKELTRWINTPIEAEYEVSRKKLEEALNTRFDTVEDFTNNVDDSTSAFIYALAQAFSGVEFDVEGKKFTVYDPEKVSTNDMLASVAKLLTVKDADQLFKAALGSKKGHIGQQLLASVALTQLLNGSEKVSTSLLFESDGKTNGMAHKALQMPIGANLWDHLRRTGIRVEGDGFVEGQHGNLADVISVEGQVGARKEADSYQTIGGSEHDLLKERLAELEAGSNDNMLSALSSLVANGLIMDLEEGSLAKELQNVSGDVRDYAKTSALEGMYGAALNTLLQNKVDEAVSNLVDTVTEKGYDAKGNWTSPYGLSEKGMLDLLNNSMILETVYEKDGSTSLEYSDLDEDSRPYRDPNTNKLRKFNNVQEFIDLARENSLLNSNMFTVKYNLGEAIRYTLHKPIYKTMNDFFGPQIEVASSVNGMMGSMFLLMKQVYEKELNRLGTEDPSEAQIEEIVNTITKVVPSVRRTSSVFDDEKIILIKEGSAKEVTPKTVRGVYDLQEAKSDTEKVKGIKGHVRNLIVNVFKKDWKEPGASSLPVITHHLDNNNIATVVNESADEGVAPFLSIFDAATLGGNNWGVVKSLNKAFIEGNLEYSFMNELTASVKEAMDYVQEMYPDEYDGMIANTKTERDLRKAENTEDGDAKVPTLETRLAEVSAYNNEIQNNRIKIFSNDLFVMQFSGAKGSYHKFNNKDSIRDYTKMLEDSIASLEHTYVFSSKESSELLDSLKGNSDIQETLNNVDKVIDEIKNYDYETDAEFRDDYYKAAVDLKRASEALKVLTGIKKETPTAKKYKGTAEYVEAINTSRKQLKSALNSKVNDIIKSNINKALSSTKVKAKRNLADAINQIVEACK